jgi:hypothetical protein
LPASCLFKSDQVGLTALPAAEWWSANANVGVTGLHFGPGTQQVNCIHPALVAPTLSLGRPCPVQYSLRRAAILCCHPFT